MRDALVFADLVVLQLGLRTQLHNGEEQKQKDRETGKLMVADERVLSLSDKAGET